jgi:hypothetical protein
MVTSLGVELVALFETFCWTLEPAPLVRERFKVGVLLALSNFERLDSSRPLLAVFFAPRLVPIRISVQVSVTLLGRRTFLCSVLGCSSRRHPVCRFSEQLLYSPRAWVRTR